MHVRILVAIFGQPTRKPLYTVRLFYYYYGGKFNYYPNLRYVCSIFAVPQFGFDPATYMLQEGPSRTVFVNIQELNGQTFAPGVTRSLVVNSQTSGGNPASMSHGYRATAIEKSKATQNVQSHFPDMQR